VALALPGALLNLPVGLLARYVATNKARTIAPNDPNTMYGALDVIASYKVRDPLLPSILICARVC